MQSFVGLQSVFGDGFSYPWLQSDCMDQQRFREFADEAFKLIPWVAILNAAVFVNGSDR